MYGSSRATPLTVLHFLECFLQPFDSLVILIAVSCSSLVFVFEALKLLFQLSFLLRQALAQGALVHSKNLPILHGLFCIFELLSRVCFAGDQLVSLLHPVLLR